MTGIWLQARAVNKQSSTQLGKLNDDFLNGMKKAAVGVAAAFGRLLLFVFVSKINSYWSIYPQIII